MGIRKFTKIGAVLIIFVVLGHCTIASAGTIYVDANTPDSNNGSSWAKAYKYLQDALDGASSSDQILVAAGTYTPDTNSSIPDGTGDRYATFQLINGVEVYGGYAGFGAPDPNTRNIELYETILSGDIDGNDVDVNDPCDLLTEPTRAENSYNIIMIFDASETVLLDGLIITAGNADSTGMLVRENSGGGIHIDNSKVNLNNCLFRGNSGSLGGAMANYGSNITLTDCKFTDNGARGAGGMLNMDGQSLTLINCNFTGNSVTSYGGGILDFNSNDTVLIGCDLNSNASGTGIDTGDAIEGGGAGMCNWDSNVSLTDCSFIGNADDSEGFGPAGGGGLLNYLSEVVVTDCNFAGNSTPLAGGGMNNYENSRITVINSVFRGNSAIIGGGIGDLEDNNLSVINCVFSGNSALVGGGIVNGDSDPNITNCTFTGNSAADYGGGICSGRGYPRLTNCILWGNTATYGNEIALIFELSGATAYINYCDVQGGQAAVLVQTGCTLKWEAGNIDSDPCFVDPNGLDGIIGTEDDDLRLSPDSNCIDAGDNTGVSRDTTDLDEDGDIREWTPLDLAGNARFTNDPNTVDTGNPGVGGLGLPVVDMGAYERYNFCGSGVYPHPPGDLSGPDGIRDCKVNFYDVAVLAEHWLEGTVN